MPTTLEASDAVPATTDTAPAATATATPAGEKPWYADLDPEVQGAVSKYKTEADLARGYASLSKLIGKKDEGKIPMPTDLAGALEIVRKIEPDGEYKIEHETVQGDAPLAKQFVSACKSAGVPAAMAKKVLGDLGTFLKESAAAQAEAVAKERQDAIDDWAVSRENGRLDLARARQVAEKFGLGPILGDLPAAAFKPMLDVLLTAHPFIAEDSVGKLAPGSQNTRQTYLDQVREIQRKLADPKTSFGEAEALRSSLDRALQLATA